MAERPIFNLINALIHLPFASVVVRIPDGTYFEAETTDRSRNLRPIRVDGQTVTIPKGGGGVINTPIEKVDIKDWRGRPGHEPGASIVFDGKRRGLDAIDNKVFTQGGIEIVYKNRD